MVDTIQAIIKNGHAYAVDGGDVFFDVASLPNYGRLSGRSQVGVCACVFVCVDLRSCVRGVVQGVRNHSMRLVSCCHCLLLL